MPELDKIELTDDSKENIRLLISHRLPWLFFGLIGSMLTAFIVSRFESVLSKNISVAFFMPLVVYISDAVGTQTQTIFVRNLAKGRDKFAKYIIKELLLGIGLGVILGAIVGIGAYVWLTDANLSLSVGLAIVANLSLAPLIALIVSEILYKSHADPALGSGPVTTIIQDIISILVYFVTTSVIFFR